MFKNFWFVVQLMKVGAAQVSFAPSYAAAQDKQRKALAGDGAKHPARAIVIVEARTGAARVAQTGGRYGRGGPGSEDQREARRLAFASEAREVVTEFMQRVINERTRAK